MRRVLLLVALACLWAQPAFAQVVHDGETVLASHVASADPHTITGKTTAGSNRVGVVHIRVSSAVFGAGNPVSVTWTGADNAGVMTEITTIDAAVGTAGGIRSYCVTNPPTSASDIVVDLTTSAPIGYVITSYNGASQSSPCTNAATAGPTTDTTPTVDVTSAANRMVVSVASAANTFSATGAGQTQEGTDVTDGGNYVMRASREAGAASVTMSYTISSAQWVTQGFSISAAAAGTVTPRGTLVGVLP
jgi:hypothetical protein